MNPSHRYHLLQLLARGGMAEVYLGRMTGAEGFEKSVVIKRMHPHLASDPRIAKMFTDEARLSSHLHHQNLVEVLDVGSGPEGIYLVMELVNGWDLGVLLARALQRGVTFPPHLTAYVGSQVLAGLVHAYKKQVNGKRLVAAHRDVSPSNILLSVEGEVKVADFGIARAESGPGGRETEPGTFKGKVAYASPEQLSGLAVNALSDQFSLGIVLHEMLTGLSPFGDPGNLVEYAQRLGAEHLFPLIGVPDALAQSVRTMLARDPGQRFAAPELAARALAEYLARSQAPANAAELQAFVEGLEPPPPILERRDVSPVAGLENTTVRASFSLEPASDDQAFDYRLINEAIDPAWTPQGPTLDASGKMVAAEPGAKVPARRDTLPEPVGLTTYENVQSLELAERRPNAMASDVPPPPNAYRDAPEKRSPLVRVRTVGFVAGGMALLAAGFVLFPRLQLFEGHTGGLAQGTNGARTYVLQISSQPPGASVRIGGTVVGKTPFISENRYPKEDVEVQVVHAGFKPWKGSLRGSEDVDVMVRLKR